MPRGAYARAVLVFMAILPGVKPPAGVLALNVFVAPSRIAKLPLLSLKKILFRVASTATALKLPLILASVVRIGVGVGVGVGVDSPKLAFGRYAGRNIMASALEHFAGASAVRVVNFPLRCVSTALRLDVNGSHTGSVKTALALLELLELPCGGSVGSGVGVGAGGPAKDDELDVDSSQASSPRGGGPYGGLSQATPKPIGVSMPKPPQSLNWYMSSPSAVMVMFPKQSGNTPLMLSIGCSGHVPLSGRCPQGPRKYSSGLYETFVIVVSKLKTSAVACLLFIVSVFSSITIGGSAVIVTTSLSAESRPCLPILCTGSASYDLALRGDIKLCCAVVYLQENALPIPAPNAIQPATPGIIGVTV